ncbi:MAG TPA: hypothetical protein DCZ13_06375 [Porticoccaceae bacterium]|nr:hypothetical protein [Porticoccaceae bacterium]
MTLLAVENLHIHLKCQDEVVKAVDGVSFQISPGETFCLVGESGSGKSVCALSLLGLLPDQLIAYREGRAHLLCAKNSATEDLLALTPHQLNGIRGKRIAMIFQEPMTSLNPVFTIGDQLIEALQLADPDLEDASARKRAIEALESVQIPEPSKRIDHYPHQLSGGQRQRVAIGRAILMRPQLLLADEPTGNLDSKSGQEVIRLLEELNGEGITLLVVTHDEAMGSRASRRLHMVDGKIARDWETGNR